MDQGVDTVIKPGLKPDFRIFTAPMEWDPRSPVERPVINMIGSSTHGDMQGDEITLNALKDMESVKNNLTIWLNHSYKVPEDIFGSLVGKPQIRTKDRGIADLHLSVEVGLENPRAVQTYEAIKKGRLLGCSVGCMVKDFEMGELNSKAYDKTHSPIKVLKVEPVEWSIVGIPANQRSWIENAIAGVFKRTLDERLVPAMKSLFPKDFERTVLSLEDVELQKHLMGIPSRGLVNHRIMWEPIKKSFYMDDGRRKRPLDRSAVSEVLEGYQEQEQEIRMKKAAMGEDHPPFTGYHDHPHSHNGDEEPGHSHPHFHNGDNDHNQSGRDLREHNVVGGGQDQMAQSEQQDLLQSADPDLKKGSEDEEYEPTQEEMLATYNQLGEILGFESREIGSQLTTKSFDSSDLAKQVQALVKSIDGMGIKALQADIKKTASDFVAFKREFAIMTEEMTSQREEIENARKEIESTREAIEELKDMPLGRPTNFSGRKVNAEASYNDLVKKALPEDGLVIKYVPGIGKCTIWPKGYLAGVRPDLTSDQMACMSIQMIDAYENGLEVAVPEI